MSPRKLKMYVKEPPERESKQSMDTMDFSLHKRDDSILIETINIIPAEDRRILPASDTSFNALRCWNGKSSKRVGFKK